MLSHILSVSFENLVPSVSSYSEAGVIILSLIHSKGISKSIQECIREKDDTKQANHNHYGLHRSYM